MEDHTENNQPSPRRPASRANQAPPRADRAQRRSPSLSELITLQWQHERGEVDLENFLLAIYFMRLGTLVDRAYDRHCQAKFGINGGDMRLMLALRRSGPPYVKRPTDLFRTLLVTSGAITKKVDRLVEMAYVERLPDPSHSGGFLVHLTKKGLQVVEHAIEHLANHSVLAPAMAQLSPEERKQGSAFVLRVLSALESTET
ncbi:MarR family winged helix-turn-helix transcriptional regulator [Variovorax boronicumulans]|uniref:MarR family winged helix-turn-helix transcriptional regulator n=1 Tax=Variovorax boronicumulans TaxID=436515 RepID=UPI0035A99490